MATHQSILSCFVCRPTKIIKNFLKVQITFSLLALCIGYFLPYKPFEFSDVAKGNPKSLLTLFNKEELAKYNGEHGQPLHLALLGSVYDLSNDVKHYGAGSAYNFFVGRDTSVSFITGEFENLDAEIADDVIGQLGPKDLLSLANWQRFYEAKFLYRGKLMGRFYDQYGVSTEYRLQFLDLVKQAENEQLQTLYPECNIQWSEQKGTRVWCTQSSGGKERDWIGYPRKLVEVGSDNFRCACIKKEDLKTTEVTLKEYENCDSGANECFYRAD